MEKNQKELMNKRKNETEIIKQRQKRNKEEHFTKKLLEYQRKFMMKIQ